MNDTIADPTPSSRRAWAWPVGIVVGLGFVVSANAVMISIALLHPSTPAAADHWAESMTWDRELAVREHSAALGWSIATLGWRDASRDHVELRLLDADGEPLPGLRGRVTLERSDSAEYDVSLGLLEIGDGRYVTDEATTTTGLVRMTLEVEDRRGVRFVTHRSVTLDELPVGPGGDA